jgi:hypothetical protein
MVDTEELECKIPKKMVCLHLPNNRLYMERRLNEIRVIVCCNCFVFVRDFIVAGYE